MNNGERPKQTNKHIYITSLRYIHVIIIILIEISIVILRNINLNSISQNLI